MPPPPTYTWLTNSAAITALKGRLYNSNFYVEDELQRYLNEALRFWNALVEQWRVDYAFQGAGWTDFGSNLGSPRNRTVTDDSIYRDIQYMLLEPVTGGGAWAGTPQFNLAAIQGALQKRTNEFIQATRCNMTQITPIVTIANAARNYLPDTVLSPERMRFLPAANFPPNHTLTRADTQAFQYFQPTYMQDPGYPEEWSVASEPVLAFDVDTVPTVNGAYDIIALLNAPTFTPPTPSLMGIPDDWTQIVKWGALADLLAREPEATDRERSQYCLQRFTQGIQMMKHSNWMLQANMDNFPVDTPSLYSMDWTQPEWEEDPTVFPSFVQGGIDYAYLFSPDGISNGYGGGGYDDGGYGGAVLHSWNVTLVGNMPVPATGSDDYIQVSRDVFDVILSYAQRIASFKMGGYDFSQTLYMEKDFYRAATETNKRLLDLSLFGDILYSAGMKETVEETS